MRRTVCMLIVIARLSACGFAQTAPAKEAATGTMAGHVFYGDTNRPARMATVALVPMKEVSEFDPKAETNFGSQPGITGITTGLDGSFSQQKVKAGTYYILAEKEGYISPMAQFSLEDQMHPTAETKKLIDKSLQKVIIEPNATTTVEVRLERGAVISGIVTFDDGGAASGLSVQVLRQHGDRKWTKLNTSSLSASSSNITTDDEGHYRISGLSPGRYMVEADLSVGQKLLTAILGGGGSTMDMQRFFLSIYSGGVFRQADATVIELGETEQRTDEDLVIPVTKLHTVTGTIVTAHDGHVVNAGTLKLVHPDDHSEQAAAVVDKDDATFRFDFVPEGDYILEASSARDVIWQEVATCSHCFPPTHTAEKPVHSYADARQPLNVHSDTVGVSVPVAERDEKSTKAAATN